MNVITCPRALPGWRCVRGCGHAGVCFVRPRWWNLPAWARRLVHGS